MEKRWSYMHKEENLGKDFVSEAQSQKEASTGITRILKILTSAIFDPELAYEVGFL